MSRVAGMPGRLSEAGTLPDGNERWVARGRATNISRPELGTAGLAVLEMVRMVRMARGGLSDSQFLLDQRPHALGSRLASLVPPERGAACLRDKRRIN